MHKRTAFFASLTCGLLLAGCSVQRPPATPAALQARLVETSTFNRAFYRETVTRMVARLDADVAAGRPPRLDILQLSGGAEWGAFGAGFLHAWSEIPAGDARAMPEFDFVAGISTGALITPYAFLGTRQSLAQVDDLYRGSNPAYAQRRLWGFVGGKHGLYDIGELERVIQGDLVTSIVPQLNALTEPDRVAMIATTDMDLGLLRLWDVRKEAAISADRLFTAERAAIAIPGAFDPVEIDGSLHADAGLLMQFIALPDPQGLAETLSVWNAAHPLTPARIRQWIIINNKPHEPLMTVQPGWTESLPRSMALMVKSGVIGPLTALTMQADMLRRQGIDFELRWIAIPADLYIDPNLPPFDSRITVPLSDLGRQQGASQDAWQTAPPGYLAREAGDAVLTPERKP
jgi:hypothetical protein